LLPAATESPLIILKTAGTVPEERLPVHAKEEDPLGAASFAAELEFIVTPEFADIIEVVGAEDMEYVG